MREDGAFRARWVDGRKGVEVEWRWKRSRRWLPCRRTDKREKDGHRRPEWYHQDGNGSAQRSVREALVECALRARRVAGAEEQAHHDKGGGGIALLTAQEHGRGHQVEAVAARKKKKQGRAKALEKARKSKAQKKVQKEKKATKEKKRRLRSKKKQKNQENPTTGTSGKFK